MIHAAVCTHFVNLGNVRFQVLQNLFINLGMIFALAALIPFFPGSALLGLGLFLGCLLLLFAEWKTARAGFPEKKPPGLQYLFFASKKEKPGKPKETVLFYLLPILFILIQAVGSKGQILVERTLGTALEEGAISALNYAFRFFAIPFNLLMSAFVLPLVPKIANAAREKRDQEILSMAGRVVLLISFFILGFLVLINLFGKEMIAFFLERGMFSGKDTILVSDLLFIYTFSAIGWIMISVSVRVLWVYHKTGLTMVMTWAGIGVYYISGIILTPVYGVKGLAAASCVFYNLTGLSFWVVMVYTCRKRQKNA